ncbi:NAD(P)/FAD-dependent oxidoreductase [Paracoccus aeridis]|uniref:NAD(P)/FAD-dependent oxidoreductase n=1 Tax=Paracoccus aeridis TaxID=1966466 RepID=UPI0010AA4FEA|nr:FAD-binding oxidoreductase [Paracoccus aeridis]
MTGAPVLRRFDAAVLGGGIVGMSCALHLQKRGLAVAVIDRDRPGRGASYGHAGLVERSSVIPYAFPRRLGELLRHAARRGSAVSYDPMFLPRIAPWLVRYWWHSAPARLRRAGADILPLIERSVAEHEALAAEAGASALLMDRGWIEVCRDDAALRRAADHAAGMAAFGLDAAVLDRAALAALEPGLLPAAIGGIHWRDPRTTTDPAGLVNRYAALFESRDGALLRGDARTLAPAPEGWGLATAGGDLRAAQVVLALGAASAEVYRPLGYRLPLEAKRGHHLHFAQPSGGGLNRPVADEVNGFVLSPMAQGLRLATGIDLSPPGAPPAQGQMARARARASELVPLGDPVERAPWVGLRPCLPDMRPVIGPAPRHPGLWFAFGHAHHGFTLGPATGRLVAEMMTGDTPFADPAPFRAERFAGR